MDDNKSIKIKRKIKGLKSLFNDDGAMTILGAVCGIVPSIFCPCCGCLPACIGGMMGLQQDMRYIPAFVARWVDLAFAPFY